MDGLRPSKEAVVRRESQRANAIESRARALYGRVVAAWASDALTLRRLGLDRPGPRGEGASRGAERPATTGRAERWRARTGKAA